MTKTIDDSIEAGWVALARAHNRVLSVIEEELKSAKMPSLTWYDALLELEKAGSTGLRQFELGEKMLLPQYGLSRLVARIEDAGYLERSKSNDDGRSQIVYITPQGQKLRRQMWPIYADAMTKAMGNNLSTKERNQLSGLLGKIPKRVKP